MCRLYSMKTQVFDVICMQLTDVAQSIRNISEHFSTQSTSEIYLKATQFISVLASMSSINFCKYNVDEYQSDVLNSYGMFHPTGPNFRRS